MKPIKKHCCACGELNIIFQKNMCRSCYGKQYTKPKAVCKICGLEREHGGHGLCIYCLTNQRKYERGLALPMHKNKQSTAFIGVHVAESILAQTFKHVNRMPYGNEGYDFICDNGFKIDVKAATHSINKRHKNTLGGWNFHIKQNEIPDYFLCVAFDNRDNLNPVNLWLIPSAKVNHLTVLAISVSNAYKWIEYEKNVDSLLSCCADISKQSNDVIKCAACGEEKQIFALGMCELCYNPPIITCASCGEQKPEYKKGICEVCTRKISSIRQNTISRNLMKCKECGELKEMHGLGMCRPCYYKETKDEMNKNRREVYKLNPKPINDRNNKYHQENREIVNANNLKRHYADRDNRLFQKREKYYANGGSPSSDNKACTLFLGAHVAERVLSHVFDNVERMPNCNRGYDFVCGKGFKIDVKSSTLKYHKDRVDDKGSWNFGIKKNKIAEHFLCLAFDNREDLTPIHMWLIPGELVNNKQGLSVSVTTVNKWSQYEQSLDKVSDCCDEIRQ